MKKINYVIIGAIVITLVLSSTISFGSPYKDNKNIEILWRKPVSMGPTLEVTTDKIVYRIGEPVAIFLTNVGDEILSGGGPIVTIFNEDHKIVYQEATYCWYELDPGDYVEWPPWDQTDKEGKQVPVGEYVVEGFLSGGNINYVDNATFYIANSSKDDELDQYQTDIDTIGPIGQFPLPPYYNVTIAQSFIPQKEILARVRLLIGRNVTTMYPYVLAIRDSLLGENLAVASVSADEIPIVENLTDLEWIEFNFDDVVVTIAQTYYLVSYTANETDNFHAWGANLSNQYPNGTVFVSFDDGATWENESDADMCFMTYGRDNQLPIAPKIEGQTSGKAGKEYEYTISGLDPDGDELYVIINWGDNTSSGPLGPYAGSYIITKKHLWEEKGNYTITARARDPFGWGPEGTLEVRMPKTKPYANHLFLRSLQRYPWMFPILRHLLGL